MVPSPQNPLNRKKLFLYAVLFLIGLSALRLSWMLLFDAGSDEVQIEDGVLDLRDSPPVDETVDLDGTWIFYPEALVTDSVDARNQLLEVPNGWQSSEVDSPYGYGTYQLTILVDSDVDEVFSLVVPSVRNASELYVNGRLVGQSGVVSEERSDYMAQNLPYSGSFTADDGVIEVHLQVANYLDPYDGGIVRSLKYGREADIRFESLLSYSLQLILMIAFVIYAMYALVLFLVSERDRSYMYISLLLFFATITHSLSSDEKLIALWFQLDYEWNIRFAALASTGIVFTLWMLIRDSFRKYRTVIQLSVVSLSGLAGLCALFLPIQPLQEMQDLYSTVLIVAILVAIISLFSREMIRQKDIVWLLFALLALLSSYIWWGVWIVLGTHYIYYPFDLLITIGCFTIMWSKQYFDLFRQSQKQAERLKRVAEEKDEFLAQTSHELRNPFHGILNLTQTTIERNKDRMDQKSLRELETVLTVGKRLSLLLDDLFDMARLKITKPTIERKPFYVQSIISGVLDMFVFMTDESKVTIKSDIPNDLPPVYADENRIIQVLYNLIHNSVKYTEAGEVFVRARKNKGRIVLTVSDTGQGMDPQTFKRVFEPYEQGTSTKGNPESGVGLGLSISKQLVELHGETLYGHSKQNVGTEISFTLHVSHVTPKETQPMLTSSSESLFEKPVEIDTDETDVSQANILIVDDDRVNLNVIESLLSSENYALSAVQHGEEFLSQLDEKSWDLLILDVMMPHLSGYDLTAQIRKRFSKTELPILLLTARNHPDDIATGFKVGANDYIAKPVDAQELRVRVRNLVSIKQSTKQQLEMEMRWLQAQIQPHFIFNTLNTINALSTIDATRMRELIDKFSELLRVKFHFNQSDEMITVKEELSLVEAYLYIEQVRFGNHLKIDWQIEDVSGFYIPSLTIQPIVENAIKHGIMKQADGGTIVIKAFRKKDYLRIVIKDHGVGMGEATIDGLYDGDQGVGLLNTDRRLKQHFKTGLAFRSVLGVGTVVAFNIQKPSRR